MAYKSQSARDAEATGWGGKSYADYLEQHALELHEYFMVRGDHERAEEMLTRTMSESVMGNDGD